MLLKSVKVKIAFYKSEHDILHFIEKNILPLCSTSESAAGVRCPVLGSPVQEMEILEGVWCRSVKVVGAWCT